MEIGQALVEAIRRTGRGTVFTQANVTDPIETMDDYRIPDIVVVLNEGAATVTEDYVAGGPDLLVEIRSPNDETYEKMDFYSRIGVQELLIVDRDEKSLELYRREVDQLVLVSSGPRAISETTNLTFQTVVRPEGNQIRVSSPTGQTWVV